MSYIKVGKYYAFLTIKRFDLLNSEALSDKDPIFKLASTIHGRKQSEEASKLHKESLKLELEKDEKKFKRRWVEFDLDEDEAKLETWELVHDYCSINGNSFLRDIREPSEKILSQYIGNQYVNPLKFPQGKIFVLTYPIRKSIFAPKTSIEIVIKSDHVIRLKGSLKDFDLISRNYTINFSDHGVVVNPFVITDGGRS